MNGLLLLLSVVINVVAYGITRNDFCKKDVKCDTDLYRFNMLSSLIAMIVLLMICGLSKALVWPSGYTLYMGGAFGISAALCALLNMKALETGPLSYTSVIVSCAMVIPAISGMILFREIVSGWQIGGIVLMMVSFICAVDKKNDKASTSIKWLLFCLGAFLFSGIVGVMQKIHQNSMYKQEIGIFLVIAFGVSALFSWILVLNDKNKETRMDGKHILDRKRFWLCSLICGIGIALCNQINMYLSGVMAAIIFYPVVNGASMILTTTAGIVLWKERLTAKQWFGLIMGGIAILLLCNIF